MRKWIVIGATVALVLAIAAIAALLNINYLVARHRGFLIAQAEQALGRKISVSDVQATLFTGLGLRLTNFAMSDDPAYSTDNFIHAKDLQVNVRVWPLFKKDVQVKRVILHKPVIRIIRNSQGNFNFSSIGGSATKKSDPLGEKAGEPRPEAGDSLGFFVSLVDVADGEIRYVDRKQGGDLQVSQIDLKVEDFDPNQPFSVKFAAALYADEQNVALNGKVGPLGRDGLSHVPLDGEIDVDSLNVSRLKQALPQLRDAISRDFDISGVFRIQNLRFSGSLGDLSLNADIDGSEGALRYKKVFHKPAGIPLTLSAEARYTGDKLAISKSRLTMHNLELASSGAIQLGDNPLLNLSFSSRPASLEGWHKMIPALAKYQMAGTMDIRAAVRGRIGKGAAPQIEGTLSLQNASAKPPEFPKAIENLDTKVHFTGQRADVMDMTLKLGNSRIRLSAAIEKFSPLTFSYRLSTPEIWPADYRLALPEERKGDVVRNLESAGRFTMAGDRMVYRGRVTSGDGTLYNMAYKGLDAALSLADNVANIQSARIHVLKGAVQMEGDYAFNEPAPRFTAVAKAQGIDIKELYSFLDPKAENDIRGRMNAEMSLSGSGKTWEAIQPTLRGHGAMEVLHGALLNFNIAEGTLAGITGMPGLTHMINPALRKKYPETFTAKDTEFKELKGTFEMAEGRVNVKNLRMAAAEFNVQGDGWVDFTRKIQFPAMLTFSRRFSADLALAAREAKYFFNNQAQLEIPMTLNGRLPNVKPKPDLRYLGQVAQRGFLGKGVEELQSRYLGRNEAKARDENGRAADGKQKKRSSTEDLIRKGLKSLFKQ
jgi:AsmA protein